MIGLNYIGMMGQLGNQMFQYASLMGIADKIGTSITIPKHNDEIYDSLGNKLRIELFDAFKIQPDNIGYIDGKNRQESKFEFDQSFFNLSPDNDFCLIGFFQTEKYFSHIRKEVEKQFTFHDNVIEDCKDIIELYDKPVAIHIRRGDYLINSDNHHNLSMEYYEEALKYFPDRQVVIFSDDPEWCLENPLFAGDRFIVSEGNGPYHDLYLMSMCDDFIIANSTYSWWGAWLSNRGTVIVPNIWFGVNNSDKSVEDLYPEHWKIIPYS